MFALRKKIASKEEIAIRFEKESQQVCVEQYGTFQFVHLLLK